MIQEAKERKWTNFLISLHENLKIKDRDVNTPHKRLTGDAQNTFKKARV
jgi:hypothetical protein